MLTASMLDEMIAHAGTQSTAAPAASPKQNVVQQLPEDLARTVAPISEPEPVDLLLRNNLPDWNQADFSMHASDVGEGTGQQATGAGFGQCQGVVALFESADQPGRRRLDRLIHWSLVGPSCFERSVGGALLKKGSCQHSVGLWSSGYDTSLTRS